MTDDIDDEEPTAEEAVARIEELQADLERLQAEYAGLTDEERTALPESVRAFFGTQP